MRLRQRWKKKKEKLELAFVNSVSSLKDQLTAVWDISMCRET